MVTKLTHSNDCCSLLRQNPLLSAFDEEEELIRATLNSSLLVSGEENSRTKSSKVVRVIFEDGENKTESHVLQPK